MRQAFIFNSAVRAKKGRLVKAEKEQRRMHVPVMDRTPEEPPPFVVLVQGPPGVRTCAFPRHHFMAWVTRIPCEPAFL